MILLDTNIVIYLQSGKLPEVHIQKLRVTPLNTCNIIVAEVLGYNFPNPDDSQYFEALFITMKNRLLDTAVTKKVIELRRTTPLKMPDAIIAATALVHDLTLWTHNTADFKNVPDLQLFDPLID